MTKRGSRRRGNRKGQSPMTRTETVCGKDVELVTANSNGLSTVVIQPNTFVRALAIADNFAFYRFKRIRVTIHPNISQSTDADVQLSAGFIPGVAPDTPPAADNDVYTLTRSMKHGYGKTTPTSMTLGFRDLVGDTQVKWFKTIAGTPDAQFEIQGNVFFWNVGRGANVSALTSWNVTFDWEMDVQSFVPASSTPFIRLIHLPRDQLLSRLVSLNGEKCLKLDPDMLGVLKLT